MIPYKSNSDKENCSPVSSNCVTWQGPNISCINLCKGDSVSDVVYKLATQLCDIKDSTDMTSVDFNCLLTKCAGSATPLLTIAGILQLIIDTICCSVTGLTGAVDGLTAKTDNLYEEPILNLPSCLQYIDPITGLPVTQLVLSKYVLQIASTLCSLASTVSIHTAQISNIEDRVVVLEEAPCCYVAPVVFSDCAYGSIPSGVPLEMNVLLESLNTEVCGLRNVVGTNTQINNASIQQCQFLGSQPALSQPGTMSSLTNWNNSISSFAQSMQNLWITVCDMRDAMYALKNCCAPDCSSFLFNYYSTINEGRTDVTVYFDGYGTVIPTGFTDCPTLTSITITDGAGHIYSDTFSLITNITSFTILALVEDYNLDIALPYTITINACVIKDGITCSRSVTQVLNPPTTTTTTTTCVNCFQWKIDPNAADLADATGNTDPLNDNKIIVIYNNCIGALSSTTFTTSTLDQFVGCSCGIPNAFYYKNNVALPITAGSLRLGELCSLL